jgi:hypothetical protein
MNTTRWTGVLLVAAGALSAGCTTISDAQCRSADWYKVGERDGLIHGLRPQVDIYAHQCGRHGVQVAENEYMAGWTDGYREFTKRSQSDSGSPP